MVKAVIFDCFGVLYGNSASLLRQMCPPDKQQQLSDLYAQNDYGFMKPGEFVRGIAGLLGVPEQAVSQIMHNKHVRNNRLIDFVREVKAAGAKTGLLSNAASGAMDSLFSPEELNGGLFDVVVVSADLTIAKPNPQIFTHTAMQLGVPPGDCLMVDDLYPNCEGAEVAGMQSVWYADDETAIAQVQKLLLTI